MADKKPIKKAPITKGSVKERALQIIKKEFPDHLIIYNAKGFVIIAYKKDVCVMTKINSNPMQPYQREDDRSFCIMHLVSFENIDKSKDAKEWIHRGCLHSCVTKEGFFVAEVKS